MTEQQRKKTFLNLPKFIGGTEAFRKFIGQNLRYPNEALEAKIEGRVLVGYDIDDNGIVHNPRILKGLGYGCDEEAMRVVSQLRFEKVKNRGMRVKVTTKTNINFKLPTSSTSISYTVTSKPAAQQKTQEPQPPKETPVTYNYTINL
ncbi:MAG: energy transducer TonB [Bacteroidales bacterium]|nr:energy transducer TonB [Bacteroidales bacterium]MDZ4203450.1 energy transducer TonB [Bacteroidales bacterium]